MESSKLEQIKKYIELDHLTEREVEVCQFRFGLGKYDKPHTLEEVAEEAGTCELVICDSAFKNCNKLSRLELPGPRAIGRRFFYGCTSLRPKIDFTNVLMLGKEAFYKCYSLGPECRMDMYEMLKEYLSEKSYWDRTCKKLKGN